MALEENWKEFFEDISLDNDGNVNIVIVPRVPPVEDGVSQYNVGKSINLTPERYLIVYQAN